MPVVSITTDYDGISYHLACRYSKYDGLELLRIGVYTTKEGDHLYRTYIRFPLDDLPAGSTVTQVRLKLNVFAAGGAAHLGDIHAYNVNGQADPQPDDAETSWTRCATGNLYVDDTTEFRTTGIKWWTLGGTVNEDVENAKAAVNRFTLGLHEEGDNDKHADFDSLEKADGIPAVLEITYTPPPLVLGSRLRTLLKVGM